jgi:hypothetical protein
MRAEGGGCWLPYCLLSTARKEKVKLEIIALLKPIQLKLMSEAEAYATPACFVYCARKGHQIEKRKAPGQRMKVD